MRVQEIKEIIRKNEYECYGIRVDYDVKYNVGDICYKSHQWWQDDPGEETGMEYNDEQGAWDGGELSGTCALLATVDDVEEVIDKSKMYFGDNITLIAGNIYEAGNDCGEVIIENAEVLAIIK